MLASDRRSSVPTDDDRDVVQPEEAQTLLGLYDRALPQVYGYLIDRCGDTATAEDLTSETFLAAVAAARRSGDSHVSIPWLMGVARHKLIDHWRRRSRDERLLAAVEADTGEEDPEPFDAHLDRLRATDVLARLGWHHRAALTLRYVDGLPVPQVAELLGRTVHATEALLVRARVAFRKVYESGARDV
jgi:RNA polymerase sigma-70 factor (ECF subfamily)